MLKAFLKDKGIHLLSLWFYLLPVYSCMWSSTPSVFLLFLVIVFTVMDRKVNTFSFHPVIFTILLFYFVSIVGVFYTQHPYKGIALVNEQASLLLLAVIVYIRQFSVKQLQYWALLIVCGTISVALFLFVKSTLIALSSGDIMQLFYVSFAPTTRFYPTFLSLFSTISFIIIFVSFEQRLSLFHGKNLLNLIVILILGLFTFCLDSKAGTLAMFIVVTYFGCWYLIRDFKLQKLLLVPALFFMCFNLFVSSPRNLMMLDSIGQGSVSTTSTSTSQRMIFIKAAFKTIPRTMPFGEGSYGKKATPGFSKSLEDFVPTEKTYLELPAAIRRSNSHNQFLDTAMQHGIGGLLLLGILFLYPFITALKKKDYVLPLLLLVTGFYFGVEGIILKGYGVRYFAVLWLVYITFATKERAIQLRLSLNINRPIKNIWLFIKDKQGKWNLGIMLLWLVVALVLMFFIATNDIIINYNSWGERAIRETRSTYIPWFGLTLFVFLLRSLVAFSKKERNNKWIVYLILLLFQPLMVFFYM